MYKWTPAPFARALLSGCAALVVVGLATRPEDRQRLAAFFDKMRPYAGEEGQEMLLAGPAGLVQRGSLGRILRPTTSRNSSVFLEWRLSCAGPSPRRAAHLATGSAALV